MGQKDVNGLLLSLVKRNVMHTKIRLKKEVGLHTAMPNAGSFQEILMSLPRFTGSQEKNTALVSALMAGNKSIKIATNLLQRVLTGKKQKIIVDKKAVIWHLLIIKWKMTFSGKYLLVGS